MKKAGDKGWLSKSQHPTQLPKYKPPRQTTAPDIAAARSRQACPVIDMPDCEAREEDESEDEMQFGLVYERYGETDVVETQTEKWIDKGIKMLSERESDEMAQHGDVLTWSPDSQVKKPKTKKRTNFVYLIEETQEGTQENLHLNEEAVGHEFIGRKVAKKFEAGVFIGEVISVAGKRGRHLYKIVYEDADGEDMNDKEFLQACAMFRNIEGNANDDKEEGRDDLDRVRQGTIQ
jgi:hypothetical protein